MSRRVRFVILLAVLALAASALAPGGPPAEILLTHGAVYTVDGARSWAEAVGIAGGRIVFVGTDAASKDRIGPNTRVVKRFDQVVGKLGDRDVRPDRGRWCSRSAERPKIQHRHRTRGRDLRIHRNHANLPGSSDNALLINASPVICNMTSA